MGNEESQLALAGGGGGGAGLGGGGGPMGGGTMPNFTSPFSAGNPARAPSQGQPFRVGFSNSDSQRTVFTPGNSQQHQGFHHVPSAPATGSGTRPFFSGATTASTAPLRFPGPNQMRMPTSGQSAHALSAPKPFSTVSLTNPAATPAHTAPSAVDLSGLTAEEKRQIAAVMERAQAMQEPEPTFRPTSSTVNQRNNSFSGPSQPSGLGTLNFSQLKGPIHSTAFSKPTPPTSDPLDSLRIPAKVPTPSAQSTLTQSTPEQPRSFPPFPKLGATPVSQDPRLLFTNNSSNYEHQRSLSSSFSSVDSGSTVEEFRSNDSTAGHGEPLQRQGSQHQVDSSHHPHMVSSEGHNIVRPVGAQVETCPLCYQTELKIVTVHGKPQPLIGQLCARCQLIVCSKCGKVKKGSDPDKKAYWLCSRCVGIAWSPPNEAPPELSHVTSDMPQHYQTYNMAPLTHLVTADNQVHSDVLRSSAASFFDEPEYVLTQAPDVMNDGDDDRDTWNTSSFHISAPSAGQESHRGLTNLFQQIPDESNNTMDDPSFNSPTNDNRTQGYNRTSDDDFWQQRTNKSEPQWKEQPASEAFMDDLQNFSSQESLYEIQEEETSDYGSQIQAACSDIASLSSSTSGHDFGVQKSWSAPLPQLQPPVSQYQQHSWHDQHHGVQSLPPSSAASESEHLRGLAIRRSHLVENFRSVPISAARPPLLHSSQNQKPIPMETEESRSNQRLNQGTQLVPGFPQTPKVMRSGTGSSMTQEPFSVAGGFSQSSRAGSTGLNLSASSSVNMQNQNALVPGGYTAQRNQPLDGQQQHQQQMQKQPQQQQHQLQQHQQLQQQQTQHQHFQQQQQQHLQQQQVLQSITNRNTVVVKDRHRPPPQLSGHSSSSVMLRDIQTDTSQTQTTTLLQQTSNVAVTHMTTNTAAHGHTDAEKRAGLPQAAPPLIHNHYNQHDTIPTNPARRTLIHQNSRDEVLLTSEVDEFDSALDCSTTDGGCNVQDFDTISQSSLFSTTSTATFPLSSSMTGLNKDERRTKRRLPLLPKDDQLGYCITPEERERQKRELKRRLSGNLLKLAASSDSSLASSHLNDPASTQGIKLISSNNVPPDWPTDLALGFKTNKVIKRKKHKHLPQTPQDAPKVQQLKQQLRMLAARKAGFQDHYNVPFGSLPNNPLDRFKSISGDDISSSQEYLAGTDTTTYSSTNTKSNILHARQYHHTSDPALFKSVLEQYHNSEAKQREDAVTANWISRDIPQLGGVKPMNQYHSDPEIQDIVSKLQQINRDLAETKELFRQTSSLDRRNGVQRWKSDADLSDRRWRYGREAYGGEFVEDWRRPQPWPANGQHIGHQRHPLDRSYQDNPLNQPGRFWDDEFFQTDNAYDYRAYEPRYDQRAGGLQPGSWNDPFLADPFVEQYSHQDPHDLVYNYGAENMHGQIPYPVSLSHGDPGLYRNNYGPYACDVSGENDDLYEHEPRDEDFFFYNSLGATRTRSQSVAPPSGPMLDAPLPDSRISDAGEPGSTHVLGTDVWDDEKENLSETNSDGLDSAEKMSRSMSLKKPKKDHRTKYNFATKRILLTRDPKDRSVSGNGLGVRIAGGKLIPNTNTLGAFISKIYDNGIVATLGEVKEGDQVLEWNGVSLHNKSYEEVQEVLETGNGEVELLIRCDYNIRDLEARAESNRERRPSNVQADKSSRIRDYDSGERSPLPTRQLLSARKQDNKTDEAEEVVYRAPNQLAPPSPGGMQRKKSTTSSGHQPVTGDIMLRMTYERCTLTLQVIKARSLKPADKSGFSDPYCKLSLVPGRAEYKYRTRHIMQTLNPEWKETFTFQSIDPNEIHHKQIEITVWDWDRLSADDFLGEVTVDLADPVHLDGTKRWYPLGERRPGATDDM